jgi:hypothetical protein
MYEIVYTAASNNPLDILIAQESNLAETAYHDREEPRRINTLLNEESTRLKRINAQQRAQH